MALSIRTERLTANEKGVLERHARAIVSYFGSPLVPGIVAVLGVACVAAAFRVWPRSIEGAATLVLMGAVFIAVGGWIGLTRLSWRRWHTRRAAGIRREIDRGDVRVISLRADAVRKIPEFDEDYAAVLYPIGPEGYLLVTEDVLSRVGGWTEDSHPDSLEVRMLPGGTVIEVRGSGKAAMAEPLNEDQRTRLLEYLYSDEERSFECIVISPEVLGG